MTRLVNIRVTSQKALVSGGCGEPFVLGPWPRLVRIKEIRLLNGVAARDFSVQLRVGHHVNEPNVVSEGGWHLPFIHEVDMVEGDRRSTCRSESTALLKKVSTGRCARVSYLTHEGVRDLEKDVELHDRLCAGPATGDPGHWSPFEHVARALNFPQRSGNFIGWAQYRKEFEHEHFGGRLS